MGGSVSSREPGAAAGTALEQPPPAPTMHRAAAAAAAASPSAEGLRGDSEDPGHAERS